MRETPAEFRRRAGRSYAPPGWLRMRADPLGDGEPCPTLFRYPGACGVDDLMRGRLKTLAPESDREVFMAAWSSWSDAKGAGYFGTIAVLAPLVHEPCKTSRPGVYLGVNREWDPDTAVWIPPSRLDSPLPWDDLRTARDVEEALGPALEDERRAVADSVSRYLHEVARANEAAVPRAPRPWCETDADTRRRLLAERGVEAVWSALF